MIAKCQSNSAIAVRLFVAPSTVKSYVNIIFRRLDVQRAERKPWRQLGRCTSSPASYPTPEDLHPIYQLQVDATHPVASYAAHMGFESRCWRQVLQRGKMRHCASRFFVVDSGAATG